MLSFILVCALQCENLGNISLMLKKVFIFSYAYDVCYVMYEMERSLYKYIYMYIFIFIYIKLTYYYIILSICVVRKESGN